MAASTLTAWVWYISGGVACLLALILLYRALIHDRSRGRARCPRCWYDLSHTEPSAAPGGDASHGRCPECGYVAKREKALFRTRRRWRLALLAMLMALAGAFAIIQPKVQRDGWWSLVPNQVMFTGVRFTGNYDGAWCREVLQRLRYRSRTSDEQFKAFIGQCIEGDPWARPLSEPWRRKYGRFLSQISVSVWQFDEVRSGDDERTLTAWYIDRLYDLPAYADATIRDRWPRGKPLVFNLDAEDWWPRGAGLRATFTPHIDGAEPIVSRGFIESFETPAPDAEDEITVAFDVQIEQLHHEDVPQRRLEPGETPPWKLIDQRTITRTIRFVDSIDALLSPIRSRQLDAGMAGLRIHFRSHDGRLAGGGLRHTSVWGPEFEDIAIGIWVEVLRDDEVIARKPMWWRGGKRHGVDAAVLSPVEMLVENPPIDELIAEDADRLTARVRSDPAIALRVPGVDAYWEGKVTIPLIIDDQVISTPAASERTPSTLAD